MSRPLEPALGDEVYVALVGEPEFVIRVRRCTGSAGDVGEIPEKYRITADDGSDWWVGVRNISIGTGGRVATWSGLQRIAGP
jgi:hypothetical protein